MANPNPKPPPKHTRWKKGQTGNPAGRPKPNPLVVALKNLTVETYRDVIEKCLTATAQELKAVLKHPETTALQAAIIKCFIKAANTGDYTVVERIAERIVGKIPEELKVTSLNANLNAHAEIPQEVANEKVKAALAALKEEF
jgi:Family of unknown function (DUF5681)